MKEALLTFQSLAHRWLAENPLSGLLRTLMPSAVRLAGAGLQFLSTVIVARTLGEELGAPFFFWSSVVMTAGPIATYGLEQIALRTVPRLHESGPEAVARFLGPVRFVALIVSILLGLGLLAFEVLSEKGGAALQAWHLLPPLALAAIAANLINSETLKGLSRPVLAVVYGHLLPVSLFCILMLSFAGRLHSPGVLALYTFSYAAAALAVRFGPVPDLKGLLFIVPRGPELRSILREGFPVCCVNLFGAAGFIFPLALLEITRPAAEVAYVSTAFRIGILFIVLSSAIHGVFAPAMSRAAIQPAPIRPLLHAYGKSLLIALVTLAPALLAGIAFPGLVMSVFGESFRNGADTLRLLLLVQIATLCFGPVPQLLLMTGHTAMLARLGLLKLLIVVALSAILVPSHGGIGMVVAMGVSFIAEEIVGLAYAIAKLRSQSA